MVNPRSRKHELKHELSADRNDCDLAGNMVQVAADLMTIFKIISLATTPQIRDSKTHSGGADNTRPPPVAFQEQKRVQPFTNCLACI